MIHAEPLQRIVRDAREYRDEAAGRTGDIDELNAERWAWEDLFLRYNALFARIEQLDSSLHREWRTTDEPELLLQFEQLHAKTSAVLREVTKNANALLLPQVDRIEQEFGQAHGGAELRQQVAAAEAALTPDDHYFTGDVLDPLSDQALAEHRADQTAGLESLEGW